MKTLSIADSLLFHTSFSMKFKGIMKSSDQEASVTFEPMLTETNVSPKETWSIKLS